MQVSSPAGMSHLAIKLCQPRPTLCEWQMCEGISPLHLSVPPSLQVTATHQPCHRAGGAGLCAPLTQAQ